MKPYAYAGSDLACETVGADLNPSEGTTFSVRRIGGVQIERLHIQTAGAAKRLQKPRGSYVTFACGRLERIDGEKREALLHLLSGELRGMAERLTGRAPDEGFSVFVAGLGNAELTADALGPKTIGSLTVTRHLRTHETELFRAAGCASISALAPGVLGQTGIETAEILRSAVNCIHPDLTVIVDALAARSCSRLASTVQLSDAGIAPGSGVGNHRSAITAQTLGCPVLVIGVPTVVHSSALVFDVLREAGMDQMEELCDSLRHVLRSGKSFFVSPKECDVICTQVAALLADAISMAFGGAFGASALS